MEAQEYTPKLVNGGHSPELIGTVESTKMVLTSENKLQSNSVKLDSTLPSQYYTPNNQLSTGPNSQSGNPPPPPNQLGNYPPRAPQQFNSQPYNPQQFQPRGPQQGPVLRRADSRSYIPPQQGNLPPGVPGQQRLPLNFQPQNWNRPLRPPIRPEQFRPQSPNSDQYRPQQVRQNSEQYRPLESNNYRPIDSNRSNSTEQPRPVTEQAKPQGEYTTNDRRPSDGYNPPPSGQYYQQNQQQRQQQIPSQQQPGPYPTQRPPLIRKPSPWLLLKEKLPPHIQGNRFPFPLRNPTPDNMSQNRSPSADQRPQPGNPIQYNGQPPTPVINTPNSQMERTTLNFSMADMPPRQIPPNVRPIRPLMRVDSRMMSPSDPNFRMPLRPGMMPGGGRDSPSGPPGMRMPNYPENPNYQRPPGLTSSQPSSTTSSTPKSHRSSIDEDEDVNRRDLPPRPPSAGGNIDQRLLQEKRLLNQRDSNSSFKMDEFANQNGRNLLRPEMVRMDTPPLAEVIQKDGRPPFESSRWSVDSPVKPNRPTDLKILDGKSNNSGRTPTTPMTPTSGDLKRHSSLRQSKRYFSKDGDNDSGVDENTQSKDSRTGVRSPLKSPSSRLNSRKLTPTRSPMTPKSPDGSTSSERKKVPMNKVQVGSAPSPNLKKVTSKIGSLQNAHYKPGGGKVKIENRKLEWKAEPRIAAKNDEYVPGGGDKKIEVVKLNWTAKPKVGSLDNATHKPGGGDKKIESVKLDFKDKAKSKVGSKDNLKHSPGGGAVKTAASTPDADTGVLSNSKIEDQKLDIKAQSKVGSLDNVKHKPGGGEKKIFDDKDYLKQKAGGDSKPASEVPSENQEIPVGPERDYHAGDPLAKTIVKSGEQSTMRIIVEDTDQESNNEIKPDITGDETLENNTEADNEDKEIEQEGGTKPKVNEKDDDKPSSAKSEKIKTQSAKLIKSERLDSAKSEKEDRPDSAKSGKSDKPNSADWKKSETPVSAQSEKSERLDSAKSEKNQRPESAKSEKIERPESAKSEKSERPESAKSEKSERLESAKSGKSERLESAKSEKSERPESAKSEKSERSVSAKSEKSERPESAKSNKAERPVSAKSENNQKPDSAKSEKGERPISAKSEKNRRLESAKSIENERTESAKSEKHERSESERTESATSVKSSKPPSAKSGKSERLENAKSENSHRPGSSKSERSEKSGSAESKKIDSSNITEVEGNDKPTSAKSEMSERSKSAKSSSNEKPASANSERSDKPTSATSRKSDRPESATSEKNEEPMSAKAGRDAVMEEESEIVRKSMSAKSNLNEELSSAKSNREALTRGESAKFNRSGTSETEDESNQKEKMIPENSTHENVKQQSVESRDVGSGRSESASSKRSTSAMNASATSEENILEEGNSAKPGSSSSTHTYTKTGSASSLKSQQSATSASQIFENVESGPPVGVTEDKIKRSGSAVSQDSIERPGSAISRNVNQMEDATNPNDRPNSVDSQNSGRVGSANSLTSERLGSVASISSINPASAASNKSGRPTSSVSQSNVGRPGSSTSEAKAASFDRPSSTTSQDRNASFMPVSDETVDTSLESEKIFSATSRESAKSGSQMVKSFERENSVSSQASGKASLSSQDGRKSSTNSVDVKTANLNQASTGNGFIVGQTQQRPAKAFDKSSTNVEDVKRFIINEKRQSGSENISKMVDSYVNENQLFNGQVISFKNDIKDVRTKTEDAFKDF